MAKGYFPVSARTLCEDWKDVEMVFSGADYIWRIDWAPLFALCYGNYLGCATAYLCEASLLDSKGYLAPSEIEDRMGKSSRSTEVKAKHRRNLKTVDIAERILP